MLLMSNSRSDVVTTAEMVKGTGHFWHKQRMNAVVSNMAGNAYEFLTINITENNNQVLVNCKLKDI